MSTYEISKSALLNLKAEILRKQDDLVKAKFENAEKLKVIKKRAPLELKNKGVEERKKFDYTEEELDLLKISRSKLESKAKLYEQLSSSGSSTEILNRKYLVRFDKKDSTIHKELINNECDEKEVSDNYDDEVDSSEEWVEYVDCLGRSRKCLRKDLEYFKSKDEDLKLVVEKRQMIDSVAEKPEENLVENDIEKNVEESNEPELLSADIRRDILRQKWEKEEEELRDRSDVHYQNVLFDEARQHGVGYYAFSKDEEQRSKQQEALKNIRHETEQKQQRAKELRLKRDKQIAARIQAAKNRRRERLGLPPEEEPASALEDEKQKIEEEKEKNKLEEEKKKEEEEEEKRKMEIRKKHLRPWDIGKEGLKEHYVMNQHEWNEKKRSERPSEFAPPTNYNSMKLKRYTKDNNYKEDSEDSEDHDDSDELMKDYEKSRTESVNPYKHQYTQEQPESQDSTNNKRFKPTSDGYHISDTVEAGLKFLRSQMENDKNS